MRFQLLHHPTLPCLAWCARVTRGRDTVPVLHGSQVEAGPGFFVDGAWDRAFGALGFDTATAFTGTGGKTVADGVLFSPPSHPLERLFCLRLSGSLLFSNSLVFLLSQADDGLDLDHPDYQFDVLRHYRAGLRGPPKELVTAHGRRVLVLDRNARVTADLELSLLDRNHGRAPRSYREFAGVLEETVGRVMANAEDPARSRPYRSLSAVSRGYDSAAVSVLAARAGCERAVTFVRSGHRTAETVQYLDDDGSAIGRRLGMDVRAFERHDAVTKAPVGPQEQYVNVYHSTEREFVMLGEELEGSLFMTGRHGEQFWNLDPWSSHPWFFDPCSVSLAGAASTERRLRMGYLNFPVPYVLGVFAPALNRIGRSEEMAPWRIGGSYDRPLARRILEDADVPRDWFGQVKMGGSGDDPAHRQIQEPWLEDFETFYRERVDGRIRSRLVERWPDRPTPWARGKMSPLERWMRTRPGVRALSPSVLGNRLHHRYRCKYLYTFHWGFEGLRERYVLDRPAPTPAPQVAAGSEKHP